LGEEATFTDAIEAVAQGSHACATILEDTGETVGRALAMVCNVVDPDAIVLGGDLALAGPVFGDAVHTAVRRRALPLVTRRLEPRLATTREDPHAAARAALAAMRADTALGQELVAAVLEGCPPRAERPPRVRAGPRPARAGPRPARAGPPRTRRAARGTPHR